MTLQQLKYIVCIADIKSINKAASRLFVSQPALSNTVRDLEDEIGIELFVRSNRGIAITPEGEEFLSYARQMVELQGIVEAKYIEKKQTKRKFSVSLQHYSFAVEAFIELAKEYGMADFEFAIHETKTGEVIENVKTRRSELGILYMNDFNRKVLQKIISDREMSFIPMFQCGVYVYLHKDHPLAGQKTIDFENLKVYPCLSFEQGENNSFYFAEEVYSTHEYKQVIKADDRATMLNLMAGLNGYTLCSGIVCDSLSNGNYKAVPLNTEEKIQIGYIKNRDMPLSNLGKKYVEMLKKYEKFALKE